MRTRLPPLLWCLLWVSISPALPVHAATIPNFCAKDFGNLARTKEEIHSLTANSYGQLLDLVRDAGVKQRVLESIVEANDPFALPKEERDLTVIEKPLAKLREMLKELKWESPELSQALVAEARSRLKGADQAKVRVETAAEENVGIKQFAIPDADFSRQSPDGRYFYSITKGQNGHEIVVHDTVTGKTEAISVPGAEGSSGYSMAVTSDGTKLVLGVNRNQRADRNQVFQVHELVNGKPNPKGTRIEVSPRIDASSATTAKAETRDIQKVVAMADPNLALANVIHENELGDRVVRFHVVDLAQGKSFPLDPPPADGWWEAIEGSNALSVIPQQRDPKLPRSMQIVEVKADGKVITKTLPLHAGLNDPVLTANAYGDRVALPDDKSGGVVVYDWRSGNTVRFPAPRPQKKPVRPHAYLHPNGKEIAVLEIDQTKSVHQVYWYDIATQKKLGEFTLPLESLAFSPDGRSFVVRSHDDVRVIPLPSLLPGVTRP